MGTKHNKECKVSNEADCCSVHCKDGSLRQGAIKLSCLWVEEETGRIMYDPTEVCDTRVRSAENP